MSLPSRRGAVAFCLICLFLFMALEWLPWMIEDQIWPDDSQRAKEWTFWLQTVSGNWSPDHPPVSRWAYAFSAIVAVLLNNATLLAVISLIWRLAHLWRRDMRVNQAFTARDQMNKQALYKKFADLSGGIDDREMRKRVDESFEEGKARWREHLVVVFGHEEAGRLFALLEKVL